MNKRKILALLLAVAMVCSLFVSPALAAEDAGEPVAISDTVAPTFSDVAGYDWAEDAIYRWAEAGIVEGDGDGSVNPGRSLRRCELASLLARLLGLKTAAPAGTFSDVTADAWYADAVLKCAQAGIMLGDGTGKANPESPIDRQQAIVMIGRAIGAKPANTHSLDRFVDGSAVADWAAPYMATLTNMGILSGLPVGEDSYEVAPARNIDRASTFVLLDKAIGQYITAPCDVTVNDANKFVVINSAAEEAGVVTVTGTTAGVVIGAGTTDAVVLDKATVGTLKVDAPVDVTINRGSAVTDLDANAAADVENNGSVTNLNTNADDVTFDGNKPSKVTTADDVKPATDSKGVEVTAPATSGGSTGGSSTTSYKYKVSVASATGGKVTASVTQTNTADTEVTLTVTPNAQTSTAMPYVLKSLTVKAPGEDGVETDITSTKTFTMSAEGTYTVTPVFEQPITDAAFFVANGTDKTSADMEAFGYPANNVTSESLSSYPYLFVGMKKGAEGYTISDFAITANGENVTLPSGWGTPSSIFSWAATYVNSSVPTWDPNGENADKLNLTGSAYAFVLTFKVNEAEYEFSCNYRDPAKADETFYKVTFKTSTGTTVATYEGTKGEQFTVPAAPAIENKYFAGWTGAEISNNKVTLGEADLTVTANYVDITAQTVTARPAGPAGEVPSFDYAAAYTKAGMTLSGSKITVDGDKLIKYLVDAENATEKGYLEQEVQGAKYVYFGVQFTAPAGATKVTEATKTPDFTGKTALSLAEDSTSGDGTDVLGGKLVKYFPMAKDGDVVDFIGTASPAWNRYYLWTNDEGEVKGVTHLELDLETTVPSYTVTFVADEKTVAEVKVDYNTALVAAQIPEVPAKVGYTGVWGDTTGNVLADKTIEAVYTAVEYTVKVGETALDTKYTVADKEAEAVKTIALADLKAKAVKAGWNVKALMIGETELTADIPVTDLPKYASEDNTVTVTPVYEAVAEVVALTDLTDFNGWDGLPDASAVTVTLAEKDKEGITKVTGELTLVENFTGFNGAVESEQSGYYAAIEIKAPQGTTGIATDVDVIRVENEFSANPVKLFKLTGDNDTLKMIIHVANKPAEGEEAEVGANLVTIYVNWNGVMDGDKVASGSHIWKLDFSGVTLKAAGSTTPDQPTDPEQTASLSSVEEPEAVFAPDAVIFDDEEVMEIPVLD